MDPKTLVTKTLLKQVNRENIYIILGTTKSGKSTIAREISAKLDRKMINTDDIREQTGDENRTIDRLESIFLNYHYSNRPVIISGVHCVRLVRRIAMKKNIKLNIIKVDCDDSTIEYFYRKDNEYHKWRNVQRFNKALNTIWRQFKSLSRGKIQHQIVYLNTSLEKVK